MFQRIMLKAISRVMRSCSLDRTTGVVLDETPTGAFNLYKLDKGADIWSLLILLGGTG